jgi:hypothetical protein
MPVLDTRDAEAFFTELEQRLPAFTPEIATSATGSTTALLRVLGRYLATIVQRLDEAPEKNFLAFLEMLGISLIPPQPARAPLVFTPLPLAPDGSIPAGTRAGSSLPGASKPLVFETESTVAMCAAKLVNAVSLWPDRDGWVDHSADLAGGRAFVLFDVVQPVEHEIFLAHDTLLAFMGKTTVEIAMNFAPAGSSSLAVSWQHWDGQVWRPFADFAAGNSDASVDGTAGLTRNGIVTLNAVCGDSLPTAVCNLRSHWIRGELQQPMPPNPAQVIALADRIQLRTTTDRSLIPGPGGTFASAVSIDDALADTTPLDLTKTFFPFGKSPNQDSVFYLVCEEAFAKANAQVTIAFQHVSTPEQDADALGAQYGVDVDSARNLLISAEQDAGNAIVQSASGIVGLAGGSNPVTAVAIAAIDTLGQAISQFNDPAKIKDLTDPADAVKVLVGALPVGVIYLPGPPPDTIVDVPSTDSAMQTGATQSLDAIDQARAVLDALGQLTPTTAAAGGGSPPPALPPPRLVWEYWNGSQWQVVLGPVDDDAVNLLATGSFQIAVPQDLSPFVLDGQPRRAIRARLASGSYNELQIVTWYDTQAGKTNYYALILPRPPALQNLCLGYTWRSRWAAPERCLTRNDFAFEDHSSDAARPGTPFAPFHPVADTLPALYLGFDKPLPNDLVSLFFDIAEIDGDGQPLAWEGWNGHRWQLLDVSDGTGALARPGMVSFLAPVVDARPTATVVSASGVTIETGGPLEAARFVPGSGVVVTSGKTTELGVIAAIAGATLTLDTPLAGSYSNATVQLAALARFGDSRDWVRARLRKDGAPQSSTVTGIDLNAAWARQLQTITNEVLGSALGRPNQTLFFSQFPVLPGERVEIRELDGARANVEHPILHDELLGLGFTSEDIRTVHDPRTGTVTEVWVRWRERDTLYFSGPDDRDYAIERTRGRLIFGSGLQGMVPPPGNNNIVATLYRAGGGAIGNVPSGSITQMMSGAPAQGVSNPRGAEGGADGESVVGVEWRGPQVTRHRWRAISAADYEALAREAAPEIALARALPATAENLRPAPGCVTVIVVPQSSDAQPQPSFELREQIAAYLAARAPASVEALHIAVIGPTYLPVGVSASVAPLEVDQAGAVKAAVLAALAQFFNPLRGGRDGHGWPFGRSVYASDVAFVIESVSGVDYARDLELLLDQIPQGDMVTVPSDRIVVAGDMQITIEGVPTL